MRVGVDDDSALTLKKLNDLQRRGFSDIVNISFIRDAQDRNLPLDENLNVISFLVDENTTGRWNLEGLPTDDLSIQNGIMTTMADRWPIMVDPQSQGNSWVRNREGPNNLTITNLTTNSTTRVGGRGGNGPE